MRCCLSLRNNKGWMPVNVFVMFPDTYTYKSTDVALFIVAWANKHRYGINLTKTQKLLYVAYGAWLVLMGSRLCNEHPQAWPYGPVFPRTRDLLLNTDIDAVTLSDERLAGIAGEERDRLEDLMAFVFDGFGKMTAGQLTVWSHQPGTPWERAQGLPSFKWGAEIPDSYIYEYFSKIIIMGKQ